MELIIKEIIGKFQNYTEVYAPDGFCFYDKDNEERNYLTRITTPLLNQDVIKDKFVLVQGNADELNEQIQKENERIREENEMSYEEN